MASNFRPNPKGIKELERAAEVRDAVKARGEAVLARARSGAPVDTGAYRAGLHLVEEVIDGAYVVRIAGGTDHDQFVEAETGNLARSL